MTEEQAYQVQFALERVAAALEALLALAQKEMEDE